MDGEVFPRRPLEHLFRLLPVLIVIPIVALALGVYVLSLQPPTYTSRATLWVTESGTPNGADKILGAENPWATPSQRQVDSFNQLLASDTFALAVAQRSGLLEGASDRETDWRTIDYLQREADARATVRESFTIYSGGTNLMIIVGRANDPDRTLALTEAATSLYLERVSTEATRKTDLAVSFYQQRVDGARTTLDQLDRELAAYVAAHPRPVNGPAPFDLAFERLQALFEAQNTLVTQLQQQLELAQLDAETALEGQKVRYALLDAPALPNTPDRLGLRKQAMPLAYALGAAGAMAAGLWYVSMATDHSVRSSEDLNDLGVPVLAFLPEFDSRSLRPWGLRQLLRRDVTYARRMAADLRPQPQQLERGA